MTVVCRPLPEPSRRVREVVANATLVARSDATEDLASFALEREHPLEPFLPGQYVSVGVIAGGRLLQRTYSVVSLDGRGRVIELLIKRLADGQLSPVLWQLGPGARLHVGPARGLFTWPGGDTYEHVFVAAGTGIAPFVAMLDEARQAPTAHHITVIHAASYADELAFGSRIAAMTSRMLDIDYRPHVSRPSDQRNHRWTGATGRADTGLAHMLSAPGFEGQDVVAWLCGSGAMVDECVRLLGEAGFPPARIRTERFHLGTSGDVTDKVARVSRSLEPDGDGDVDEVARRKRARI